MAIPTGADWFLVDWMRSLGISQAALCKKLDWPKSKMSMLFNGQRSYNREMVNQVSQALNAEPFELLLPYDRAMFFRRMNSEIKLYAAEHREEYTPAPGTGTFGR